MARHKTASELRPWHKLLLYFSIAGLMLTGSVWWVLSLDVISASERPTVQPWLLAAHGLLALLFVFVFGAVFTVHVPKHWRGERRMVSGPGLIGISLLLIASGYFLYYIGDENLRAWMANGHFALGVGFPLLFGAHLVSK